MKKIYVLLLAICSSLAINAQYNVTFQVDMTGQTISSNGVHVAGSFQSSPWTPSATTLTQVGTSNIYAATVSIAAGVYEYKFINDNDWPGVETVPSVVQVDLGTGNDNRWCDIKSDTTLPAVMFGGAAPSGMKAITLLVDMSLEATVDDTVSVAGNIFTPQWSPGSIQMTDLKQDSIYRTIAYASSATAAEYKFINGTDWSLNESVPSACASNGNRFATINNDTVIGPVCFGQCISCFIPDTFNITFRVDMQNVCGFTSDSVDIAGSLNGWSGGDYLTDPDNDDVYEISMDVPAGEIEYKIRYIQNGSTNWEGGNNKKVTLSSDTVLDIRCFGLDTYSACVPKPNPGDIRFVVDVTNYSDPNVTLSDIYLEGDFTTPSWQGGAILMTPVSGMPGLYETTVTGICPARLNFKFLNGDPTGAANDPNGYKEEDFAGITDSSCIEPSGVGGFNRVFVRPDDQPQTLAFIWNSCSVIPGIGLDEVSADQISIYPNPTSSRFTIELSENQTYDISLTDITGTKAITKSNVSGKQVIEKGNLTPGVYILTIESDSHKTKTTKLMIQ